MSSTPEDPADEWRSRRHVKQWMQFDPARHTLLGWAASLLPFAADAQIRVLDLGGGHGPFASEILAAYAGSRVCLQDVSDTMLREAADRLARFPGRFDLHLSDLRDPSWMVNLHRPFHAVVSALVTHNLDRMTVRRLYPDLVALLSPGGCFLNLELILQPPELGIVARIHRSVASAQFSHSQDGQDVNDPSPGLEDHLCWLRLAGFNEVDCLWKLGRQALLCGVRTASVPT
jgi:tRNA (cmo5U34)-methyltransferase